MITLSANIAHVGVEALAFGDVNEVLPQHIYQIVSNATHKLQWFNPHLTGEPAILLTLTRHNRRGQPVTQRTVRVRTTDDSERAYAWLLDQDF